MPILDLKTFTLAALLGTTVVAGAANVELPDIGSSAGTIISENDERRYGEALVRELHRLAHVVDDPLIDGYIKHLGYRLAAHSDQPERQFTFLMLEADSINAFAAPGGVIAVHSELMLTAETEAEVAGVLAHEVAHVTQRHLARAVESAQKVTLPMMLLMVGAAIAAGGDSDAMQTAIVGGQGLLQQMLISFTRNNEYEADRIGIHTLAAAGYDPEGMASFFGKMARLSRNYGGQGIPEFLRTHPVETTRIAEARNRAAQIKVTPYPEHSPEEFYFIRERLRVLTAKRPGELLAYYRDRIDRGVAEPADDYGLSLVYLAMNEGIRASETLDRHARERPESLPIQLAMAEIEFKAGLNEQADDRYQRLLTRFPGNLAASMAYAESLLITDTPANAAKAEQLLRPLLSRHESDAGLFMLYSRAADRTGAWVRAEEAYAQHVFLLGRVYDAVTHLEKLLKNQDLNYYERSRIEARVAEIRPILAEIQREDGYDPSEGKRDRRALSDRSSSNPFATR